MYDVAVAHMLEVLACSHQSKTTQELYLRDFLQIVQVTSSSTIFLYDLELFSVKVNAYFWEQT